jgi:hypothetical protein
MTKHILPVPSYCVETQSFAEHVARAKKMGCAYKPGMTGFSCYYYGGLDLAPNFSYANKDVPIYASASGICTIHDESPKGYGLHIRQTTSIGELVIYGHMLRTSVGSVANQGDVIGWMGSTGNSTGRHVHWETRVNGIPVDPRTLMGEAEPVPEPVPPPVFHAPILPPSPIVLVTKAITKYLNVRQKPETGKVVGKIYSGDILPMLCWVQVKSGDYWYAVILTDYTIGWAAAYYNGEIYLEVVE